MYQDEDKPVAVTNVYCIMYSKQENGYLLGVKKAKKVFKGKESVGYGMNEHDVDKFEFIVEGYEDYPQDLYHNKYFSSKKEAMDYIRDVAKSNIEKFSRIFKPDLF